MKTLYVIIFKTKQEEREYQTISNYYFEYEQDARRYAQEFIEKSSIFSVFEIIKIMHF